MDNLTLNQFLKILSTSNALIALDLVIAFQMGNLCVDGISASDFQDDQ